MGVMGNSRHAVSPGDEAGSRSAWPIGNRRVRRAVGLMSRPRPFSRPVADGAVYRRPGAVMGDPRYAALP